MPDLSNKKVAILVADGFEQREMTEPRKALNDAGAKTLIVSPNENEVQGWNHYEHADRFPVDVPLTQASADDFDALLLPGGAANPDQLRMKPKRSSSYDRSSRLGSRSRSSATVPDRRRCCRGAHHHFMPSVKLDLVNAGANWVDEECVVDNGLVSSRNPDDIPVFNQKMIEEFAEGTHSRRNAMDG